MLFVIIMNTNKNVVSLLMTIFNQAEQDLLVIAAQQGNEKAFQLLFKNYQKSLLRFAYKITNSSELAQDATQEAWIKTAKSIQQINDPRAFKSWIYRLVRWCSLDLVRHRAKQDDRSESFNETEHLLAVEQAIDQSDEVHQAIEKMPPIEKQMIHLFYLDELKISEIAAVLKIPAGTVKSRLNRARKLLKTKFEC